MTERIRLSASILADITHENRHALLVNKATFRGSGERMLTPIGGVIQVSAVGRAALIDLLGAQDEDFEQRNELRVRNVPRRALKGFANWLAQGVEREIDPLRELGEELVDENNLVALPHGTLDALAEQATRPNSMLAFVTADEIRAGVSERDVSIASISTFLIEQSVYPVFPMSQRL